MTIAVVLSLLIGFAAGLGLARYLVKDHDGLRLVD